MERLLNKRGRRSRGGAIAAVGLTMLLASSGTAVAGQDELKGGSVVLKLQNSGGMKLKPKSLNLAITGGAVDPVDGAGTVQLSGAFSARRGTGKAKVRLTTLNLGANGGRGSVIAKVGKDFVSNFASLSGGTVARAGWGATISNIRMTIAGRGAKALTKALSPKKGKGAKKSADGKVKAGRPLGTIASLTTDPRSVEVVPGTGELILHTQAVPPGPFVNKLTQHCIDPLPSGTPAGVAPISPATTSGLGGTDYHFPVTGGSAAPDFGAGEVLTGGGQTLTKNSSLLNPSGCSNGPPVGTQLRSTDLSVTFDVNFLRSIPTLPSGTTLPRAPLATIDFSTGTRSVDPATKTLNVTGATVNLADLAAGTLNEVFPNGSGDPSNDFATGDLIGKIDLTNVKLR
ncbi:MAG TPA: hypothetical protein VLB79_07845 [Solirubrobacterales bacterium]|nr:hypothetical protein [Solirubrobacterales bacterium]